MREGNSNSAGLIPYVVTLSCHSLGAPSVDNHFLIPLLSAVIRSTRGQTR
jgi:hypothetical protein